MGQPHRPKRSGFLLALHSMSDQENQRSSEALRKSAMDDRYPSQAEGDLETVEEDLKQKAQETESKPAGA